MNLIFLTEISNFRNFFIINNKRIKKYYNRGKKKTRDVTNCVNEKHDYKSTSFSNN